MCPHLRQGIQLWRRSVLSCYITLAVWTLRMAPESLSLLLDFLIFCLNMIFDSRVSNLPHSQKSTGCLIDNKASFLWEHLILSILDVPLASSTQETLDIRVGQAGGLTGHELGLQALCFPDPRGWMGPISSLGWACKLNPGASPTRLSMGRNI